MEIATKNLLKVRNLCEQNNTILLIRCPYKISFIISLFLCRFFDICLIIYCLFKQWNLQTIFKIFNYTSPSYKKSEKKEFLAVYRELNF